jgi:competence ComEA-like helix-hairpin-helix protein
MGWINDYFSFSKRERIGIVALVILIAVVFLLPEFIGPSEKTINGDAADEIRKQMAAIKWNEDSTTEVSKTAMKEDEEDYHEPSKDFAANEVLFEFDPNTLTEDGWKRLGLRDRTISTIKKYISKGGRFRKPEDIGKIYGIRKDQFERLLPYVKIKTPPREVDKDNSEHMQRQVFAKPANKALAIIDLNSADTSMLIALPGIGSKLANRIINFRNKLGGFYSIDQVKEVYGLQDSTFQKIRVYLQCDSSQIQRININTVNVDILKNHPYIKWNIANAIINYRQQHGNYASPADLLKIDIISPEILLTLIPYLKVN